MPPSSSILIDWRIIIPDKKGTAPRMRKTVPLLLPGVA